MAQQLALQPQHGVQVQVIVFLNLEISPISERIQALKVSLIPVIVVISEFSFFNIFDISLSSSFN